MVRQEDYTIGNARTRKARYRKQFLFSIIEDLPAETQIVAFERAKTASHDVQKIVRRTRHIQQLRFNLNSYSEEQVLHAFRFRKQDVGRVCRAMGWTAGRTKRNRYACMRCCHGVLWDIQTSVVFCDLVWTWESVRYAALGIKWGLLGGIGKVRWGSRAFNNYVTGKAITVSSRTVRSSHWRSWSTAWQVCWVYRLHENQDGCGSMTCRFGGRCTHHTCTVVAVDNLCWWLCNEPSVVLWYCIVHNLAL